MSSKDQDRIVALQKQLRIARDALLRISYAGAREPQLAEEALEKMNAIEWASKPNLVQEKPKYI